MPITPIQRRKIHLTVQSIRDTNFGQAWPPEYGQFLKTWGFFNSIYSTLYGGKEREQIAKFALDNQFSGIWLPLSGMVEVQDLARQPCVGDGRDGYRPQPHVKTAFHTLRQQFGYNLNLICTVPKCTGRLHVQCLHQLTYRPPVRLNSANLDHAKYSPLGATLIIIYQVRSNLVHGSKMEFHGDEYIRNQLLVTLSQTIVRRIIEEAIPILRGL